MNFLLIIHVNTFWPTKLDHITSWNFLTDNFWQKWICLDSSFSRKLFTGRNDSIYHGQRRFEANTCKQSCFGHNFSLVFEIFQSKENFLIWVNIILYKLQINLLWTKIIYLFSTNIIYWFHIYNIIYIFSFLIQYFSVWPRWYS